MVFGRQGHPGELTAMLIKMFDSYEAVNVEKKIDTILTLLTRGVTQEDAVNKMLANLDRNEKSLLYDIQIK